MHFPRTDHAQGRLHLFHGANLHRRSVRAQQQPLPQRLRFLIGDEQRILRIPRRMIGRKIQRLEVVIIRLNLRPFFHRVPKIAKHPDHLVHGLDDRMLRPERTANAGKGDVDALGHRSCDVDASTLHTPRRAACRSSSSTSLLHFVHALARHRASHPSARLSATRSLTWVRKPFVRAIQRSRNTFHSDSLLTSPASRTDSRQQILNGLVQSRRREILQLGNGVRRFFLRSHNQRPCHPERRPSRAAR